MQVYFEGVALLNFLVDFLLLMATKGLVGEKADWKRCALGGLAGGLYAGICLIKPLNFLGNWFWRILSLGLMCGIAYGFKRQSVKKGAIFLLLTMTLGGVASLLGQGDFLSLVFCAIGLLIICVIGVEKPREGLVSVKLTKGEQEYSLTALMDTGNTLKDPITGRNVLVAGENVARELLGLTHAELANPIQTLESKNYPGLRLIPFSSVGCTKGILLAAKMDRVWINGKETEALVAFAPQKIGKDGSFEALAGGTV